MFVYSLGAVRFKPQWDIVGMLPQLLRRVIAQWRECYEERMGETTRVHTPPPFLYTSVMGFNVLHQWELSTTYHWLTCTRPQVLCPALHKPDVTVTPVTLEGQSDVRDHPELH